MNKRTRLWLVSTAIYALFFAWYTDFGGPLTDDEIGTLIGNMEARGGDPETIAFIEQFARNDTGRQFLMVNSIDYRENPPDTKGAEPGESAEELMNRYMAHMIPALLSRASHPIYMGNVVYPSVDVVGIEGAEHWDMGAIFRYRSRRALLEIITNPEFAGEHHFKIAALEKTIAYPTETRFYTGDPRLLLGLLILAITALLDSRLAYATLRKTRYSKATGSS